MISSDMGNVELRDLKIDLLADLHVIIISLLKDGVQEEDIKKAYDLALKRFRDKDKDGSDRDYLKDDQGFLEYLRKMTEKMERMMEE